MAQSSIAANDFERERQQRIARNKRKIEVGIPCPAVGSRMKRSDPIVQAWRNLSGRRSWPQQWIARRSPCLNARQTPGTHIDKHAPFRRRQTSVSDQRPLESKNQPQLTSHAVYAAPPKLVPMPLRLDHSLTGFHCL